jgi:1,4-alpha-glucan branching enzyme
MTFTGMGANLNGTTCTFRVWAPDVDTIYVAGDFNDWRTDHPACRMTDEGDGYKFVSIDLSSNGFKPIQPDRADNRNDRYQYIITCKRPPLANTLRPIDPYSRDLSYDEGVNSLVVSTDWGYWNPFATPRFDDLIVYQLHIGSFAGLHDGIDVRNYSARYEQIICKFDHIRGLGFNAILFLPTSECAQGHVGYDPSSWMALESAYGRTREMQKMVDEAHRRGLAVIFDVVWNHAPFDGNLLWDYDDRDPTMLGGIYFNAGGVTPWGNAPALWDKKVQTFFMDCARMYFEEYRADGLRFDAAHVMNTGALKAIVDAIRANPDWQDKLLIAEWSDDNPSSVPHVIRYLGMNSLFPMSDADNFSNTIHNRSPAERVAAFERSASVAGFDNHWNIMRAATGTHDQIKDENSGEDRGKRYPIEKFGGRNNWYALAQCRMAWALTVTRPGIPLMFMGCEAHHWGYWFPMPDQNQFTSEHRLDWAIMGDSTANPMRWMVKDVNEVRRVNAALRSNTLEITHRDRDNGVVAFKRWTQSGNVVLVVANFSDKQWTYHDYRVASNTPGRWEEIFNSQAPQYGGYDNSGNGAYEPSTDPDGSMGINLPQWSVLVFRKAD